MSRQAPSQQRGTLESPTHQHFPDQVSWCQPYDQADHHPCDNRNDRFVNCPDSFDLEVIGGDEGANEEHTEDT